MKTILCYGDSNTFGLMPDLSSRYPLDVRWTGILQSRLGCEYHVIEEGLGGRTTVWDDPIEMHKNGKTYLLPCLESHRPIDLVILMLGTNDTKTRFHVSSFDIAQSVENLLDCIENSRAGVDFCAPRVLLICPVPVRDVGNADLNRMFGEGFQKCRELDAYYADVAKRRGLRYLAPGESVETSDTDGIHYTARGHAKMAELVEAEVRGIFEGM